MNTAVPFPKNRRSAVKKKRQCRSVVRASLHEQRQRLIGLRRKMKEGLDLGDEMDSCQGQINLLLKELQSIEEGGHTTFLQAKTLIAPKEGVSAKKTNLRAEKAALRKEISELKERLLTPRLPRDELQEAFELISRKKDDLKRFENEIRALWQYNHTRFVSAREEDEKNLQKENKLKELEQSREELNERMFTALEQNDDLLISEINGELVRLEEERKETLHPDGDPFLAEREPGGLQDL